MRRDLNRESRSSCSQGTTRRISWDRDRMHNLNSRTKKLSLQILTLPRTTFSNFLIENNQLSSRFHSVTNYLRCRVCKNRSGIICLGSWDTVVSTRIEIRPNLIAEAGQNFSTSSLLQFYYLDSKVGINFVHWNYLSKGQYVGHELDIGHYSVRNRMVK